MFLGSVILISIILYVQGLGFYSDDWAFLGTLSTSTDQSFVGLFKSLFLEHDNSLRPVQFIYIGTLYKLFGANPFGYHLTNAILILSITILFYLVIREFDLPRLLSLSVPLVYSLLPHYSSARFWIASSHIYLSIALYLLSLFAILKAINSQRTRYRGWILLSVISLVGSVFTYELAIPLFFLNLMLVWYRWGKLESGCPNRNNNKKNLTVLLSIYLLALIIAVIFKFISTERLFLPNENETDILSHIITIIIRSFSLNEYDYGINIKQAILVNFGDYGIGLPFVIWLILRNFFDWTIISAGLILGLIIFSYLYYSTRPMDSERLSSSIMLKVIAAGMIVFVLGYAIYLTNNNLFLKIFGVHNRYNTAAAAGLSLIITAGIGFVSLVLSKERHRNRLFCILVAMLCSFGFIIINTLSSFWTHAYKQEIKVLKDIKKNIPNIPTDSVLILEGICPNFGPAIVFDSSWDLAGALQLYYGDSSLRADIVTPWLKIREDGIYTSLNLPETRYAYEKMFVYDFEQKKKVQLMNAREATLYFQTSSMNNKNTWDTFCPHHQFKGLDAPVF